MLSSGLLTGNVAYTEVGCQAKFPRAWLCLVGSLSQEGDNSTILPVAATVLVLLGSKLLQS